MTAIANLLEGLFDYAGLYPPASLELADAVGNYVTYLRAERAEALGRFVVDLKRIDAVREAAGDSFNRMQLSVLVPADADWGETLPRARCRRADHGNRGQSRESMRDQIASTAIASGYGLHFRSACEFIEHCAP